MNSALQLMHTIAEPNFIERHPLVCFNSETYPLLFVSLFLKSLKKQTDYVIKTIDETIIDEPNFKAQLAVSFLGQRFIFWCSDISQWPTKQKKEFFTYLINYKGPHSIWFFTDEIESVKQHTAFMQVTLESKINETQAEEYLGLLSDNNKLAIMVLQQIFKKKKLLPLDELVLIATYAQVMSKPLIPEFINTWIDAIIAQDQSLFDLSSYFFARKSVEFFALWKRISAHYTSPFWFVYWSDQLFRAASFVKFSKVQEFNQAKKIAYKLPFSFIKKDWQLYSFQELCNAHNDLYLFDYQVKNGGSEAIIELFYCKFINRQYLKKQN